MKTITITDIKTKGSKAIPSEGVTYLVVNSKPKSVILPTEDYESLIEMLEDLEDIRDYELRKKDKLVSFNKIRSKRVV